MKSYILIFISLLLSAFMFFSCATPPKEEAPVAPPVEEKLPIEVQVKKSQEKFEEILELTADVKRRDVLPQMEVRYHELVSKYPDTYLAEESYWRLIKMNMSDYVPTHELLCPIC
jgi:hypothetical protein